MGDLDKMTDKEKAELYERQRQDMINRQPQGGDSTGGDSGDQTDSQ